MIRLAVCFRVEFHKTRHSADLFYKDVAALIWTRMGKNSFAVPS
jgi:hypothetical protein